jgi:lysophospholipase L1-like esterase
LIAAILLVSDRYRTVRAHDFPSLSRYRSVNALVKVQPEAVFIGDSITEFWDLGADFPGKLYTNRGIAAQTSSQVLLRMHQDVIRLRPKAVVIEVGTNDLAGLGGPMSLEDIEANFEGIQELAAAHHIQVIFSSLLPVNEYSPSARRERMLSIRPPAKIIELNSWLQHYCASSGAVYLGTL